MWSSLLRTVASLDVTEVNKYIRQEDKAHHTHPTVTGNQVEWSQVLFAPVHERWSHAARISRREQEADHILHTLRTQAFQEATP